MTSYRGHYSKRALLEGQYSKGTTLGLMHPLRGSIVFCLFHHNGTGGGAEKIKLIFLMRSPR